MIITASVLLGSLVFDAFGYLKEDTMCEEINSEDSLDLAWGKFELQPELPENNKAIKETFDLCRRGSEISHLVVLMHGFISNKSAWADSMRKKILERDSRKNLAILIVDWEQGAGPTEMWDFDYFSAYDRAAANTRYVGESAQRFIESLQGYPALRIHCVGHSLGAHACGFLAKINKKRSGKKIWRITGLDPAGPQFTKIPAPNEPLGSYIHNPNTPREQRLDATDAELVDVVHTDGDQWGAMTPLGHTDFYVGRSNNTFGSNQADCDSNNNLCDHTKAHQLYMESMEGSELFEHILKCKMTAEQTLSMCEDAAVKPIFGYFYNKSMPLGVFGILQADKEKEIDEDIWWDLDLIDSKDSTSASKTKISFSSSTSTSTAPGVPECAKKDGALNTVLPCMCDEEVCLAGKPLCNPGPSEKCTASPPACQRKFTALAGDATCLCGPTNEEGSRVCKSGENRCDVNLKECSTALGFLAKNKWPLIIFGVVGSVCGGGTAIWWFFLRGADKKPKPAVTLKTLARKCPRMVDASSGFFWPKTRAGKIANIPCAKGYFGFKSRYCDAGRWDEETHDCKPCQNEDEWWKDSAGWYCANWAGHDCSRAVEDWYKYKYTQEDENEILDKCQGSCQSCGAFSRDHFA